MRHDGKEKRDRDRNGFDLDSFQGLTVYSEQLLYTRGRAGNSSLEGGTDFIDDATGIVQISVLGNHRSRYHHTVREAGRNTRATRGRRSERGRGETRTCQRRIMPESGPDSARFRAQRADPIHGGHGGCWFAWRRAVTRPINCTSNIAASLDQTVLESTEELSKNLTKRFRFHLVCHLLAALGLPSLCCKLMKRGVELTRASRSSWSRATKDGLEAVKLGATCM
ncbi:hypothetical protein HDV62DRAFT_8335 [Trichoderma sp. SZMC 28011]